MEGFVKVRLGIPNERAGEWVWAIPQGDKLDDGSMVVRLDNRPMFATQYGLGDVIDVAPDPVYGHLEPVDQRDVGMTRVN